MNPLLKKNNIEVLNAVTQNYLINVDSQQIEQVLINLLTNSINALENSGLKQISILAEAKNNRIFIKVSDSGKGVEKEIEDKIFLPFFTTRPEGAGIGLTLSKNIVEAHGGYISQKSENGKTTFEISLIEE